jgi:poly(A) polymerase
MNSPALTAIRDAVEGTPFHGDLFVVGGAVRDHLLGIEEEGDLDLVTRGSAGELADLLFRKEVSEIPPVTYPAFGTAMVQVKGTQIELVTARSESYTEGSRKPGVERASYEQDASRRDFTVNALLWDIERERVVDPLGTGLRDLELRVLRTPLDPIATFHDDPLRMLRAIRFRWQLDFEPVPGLYEAVRQTSERLKIVSFERIRDELMKMFSRRTGADALRDFMDVGLLRMIAPELVQMQGVEQGDYHHMDVWNHTLLVIENLWVDRKKPSIELILAALFHDVGKPATRFVDEEGRTRFFGHEEVGAEITARVLRRWKLPEREIAPAVELVKSHMRLGSAPVFTKAAARRLIRDLGDHVENLLQLVEADTKALKPGLKTLDLKPIRDQLKIVETETPRESLKSPLSGEEIITILDLEPGPEIGKLKDMLLESIIQGEMAPGDRAQAIEILKSRFGQD